MLNPPPYFRGGGFFWFGLTPPIFLRGVATGLRSGGSPSTVLRGEYNDQGGGQFSNSGGVLWQKSWKKSTPPPFSILGGKFLWFGLSSPWIAQRGGGIFHDFCHITPSELQNYSPLIIVDPLSTEPLLTLIHCPSLIVCNSKLWVPTFSLIFMILREGVPKTPFPENTQFHSPLTVSLLKLIHRVNILSPY